MVQLSFGDGTIDPEDDLLADLGVTLTEEQARRLDMHVAWQEAMKVFEHGTLHLSGQELMEARHKARPFVRAVSREFLHGLEGRVLFERELKHRVDLQLLGWGDPLTLKYPAWRPPAMATMRHRYDQFELPLPTGSLRLRLRFRLGEGEKADNTWNTIGWGLGTWGARERVHSEAIPALLKIQGALGNPDLKLDYWKGIMAPKATWAQLGRVVRYAEFAEDIDMSVKMVATDLRGLLEATEPYQ